MCAGLRHNTGVLGSFQTHTDELCLVERKKEKGQESENEINDGQNGSGTPGLSEIRLDQFYYGNPCLSFSFLHSLSLSLSLVSIYFCFADVPQPGVLCIELCLF